MPLRRLAPIVLVFLVACGGASFTDTANKTLSTSLAATNAARDQFVSWDRAHQLEIVDAADDPEAAKAALSAYRARRVKVLHAFTVAYTTIAAAASMIPLVERGIKKDLDLIPLLAETAEAAVALKHAYDAIRGESP